MVRFITQVASAAGCEAPERETGFVVTRRGDKVQVIRTCGAEAEVLTYRAQGGRFAATSQSVDPSAVRPAEL
jgi:hypothetical protein